VRARWVWRGGEGERIGWAMVVRIHVRTPVEPWIQLLSRGQGDMPLAVAKLLAVGLASTDVRDIRRWSVLALGHERYMAEKSAEEARRLAIHTAMTMQLVEEISVQEFGDGCNACVDGILHRLALSYLYAISKAHGLRPVVHEGGYKGFTYILIAASETGLQEAIKAMERDIEDMCRRVRVCR